MIPVLNLGKIFGTKKEILQNDSKPFQIMVINTDHSDFGLIIDLTKDVKTIDDVDITPINELMSNSKDYITSTINLNDEIIQVVSIENIIEASTIDISNEMQI